MRRVCVWLVVFGLVAGVAAGTAAGKDERPQNIILIGWDGAQRNHIKECLARNELPSLKQLSSEGRIVAIDVIRVTDTKAGWTQILTGYEPEITGVFSNSKYQPIPKGYTVFERLEQFFGPDNIYTAAVIGKKGNVDAEPPLKKPIDEREKVKLLKRKKLDGKIVVEESITYFVAPGKPFYNARDGMDTFINGLGEHENVGKKTLELLEQNRNRKFFFFVHFADPDHQGHKYGENSKEYNDALIACDVWLGKIIKKLKELNLYEKTLIYVTADHGFDEGEKDHRDAPYIFLATNDPAVMRRGTRADIAPTILERFGIDLSKIEPPLDGHPLTKPYEEPLW